MDRTRRAATIALLLGLVASARVRAETESIRLAYHADPACPSEGRFVSQVLRRASNARLAAPPESAARTFVVTIEPGRTGFSGSLVIEENGARSLARQVSATNCDDLANALALSTALAIDPSANLTAEPEPNPASSTSARASANGGATDANANANANARNGRQEPANSAATPQYHDVFEDDYGPGARARSGRDGWSTLASVGPTLRAAYTPRWAFGAALALRRENNADWQPISAFGAELAYLQSLTVERAGASASMQFFLLRPELCALAVHPANWFRVGPCASAELGLVRASGADLPRPLTQNRFWAALGLWLRFELELSHVARLELAAGPSFPLTRHQFYFTQPEVPIYDVPVVGFATQLQLGIRL